MKNLLILALIAAGVAAHAQTYPFMQGGREGLNFVEPLDGAAIIPAATTNTIISGAVTNTFSLPAAGNSAANTNLIVLSVSEFDSVGYTFGLTGTLGSTNSLLVYRSYDGGQTYEANPGFKFANIAPGAARYTTNGVLDLEGVSTLAFVVENTGTADASNAVLEFNLKMQKRGAWPASR